MTKLLLASVSMLAIAGTASAQSVLERVLAQTQSLGQVTGVFANVADNIGTDFTTVYTVTGSGVVLSAAEFDDVVADNSYTLLGSAGDYYNVAGDVITNEEYNALTVNQATYYTVIGAGFVAYVNNGNGVFTVDEKVAVAGYDAKVLAGKVVIDTYTATTIAGGAGGIDGSINNIVSGLDEIQASVMGEVTAVSLPTVNFGNMATTVLGAVNTGEIGLGTNQVVEEAIAGTTQAIRTEIGQIGNMAGLTQVALNSALNTMNINGSINNTLSGVNGSVAAVAPDVLAIAMTASDTLSLTGVADLLGSMETTVLGAVNTGTIVSGVNNQVEGAVAGIVGNSATNMFAAP